MRPKTIPMLKSAGIGDLTISGMDLWWSPDLTDQDRPCNAGFGQARELLVAAADRVSGRITEHEVASDEEALALYAKFAQASASPQAGQWWDYRVSVLGTNKYPGSWAARQVPLLVVHFDRVPTPYCAPNQTRRVRGGSQPLETRTILDVLQMLGRQEQERLFGQVVA